MVGLDERNHWECIMEETKVFDNELSWWIIWKAFGWLVSRMSFPAFFFCQWDVVEIGQTHHYQINPNIPFSILYLRQQPVRVLGVSLRSWYRASARSAEPKTMQTTMTFKFQTSTWELISKLELILIFYIRFNMFITGFVFFPSSMFHRYFPSAR